MENYSRLGGISKFLADGGLSPSSPIYIIKIKYTYIKELR